ncbi:dicarboxylate/amino acid:cation symporter [Aliidiomarina quisquiliarum]|uniref:dicarboxylate/amino acid:cation symporter n=1 Tax=Aliidiomarina quisquiliarum TaxID=2938947 RepID=UPI00208EEAD3|nr:dicarboxylate/amino acid:cation symporter [Aliidiomarina quisquiliarum]MCO4320231.1 dicarboxylate/amino acid:cation symporter [Aliidiomarina quisquiliarum]
MRLKKLGLTGKILTGMIAGAIVGFILNKVGVEGTAIQSLLVDGVFRLMGDMFIASLMMLVVPLVFFSLVVGTSSLSDPAMLGRLGGKAIFLYLLTTAVAISIALIVAVKVQPGMGMNLELPPADAFTVKDAPPFIDVLLNMVPRNPVEAMAEGNMLQIIVFALLFGVAIAVSGEPGQRLKVVFEDVNDVIMKLVVMLMYVAPYGVFALMARVFADLGLDMVLSLGKYFGTVFFVLIFHGFVIYPLMLSAMSRLNPRHFLRKMMNVQTFAFSISSSNATIPVNLKNAEQRLGVDNSVASFTIPLGATINMDGTAIMQGVATVFIAQIYGIDLTMTQYLMVIATATLASIGTAGVPGVGLIMLAMVFQQVGLPVEGIALIIGVDRLLDMTRTAVNVTGDAMVTTVIAKSEGKLDEEVYNDPKA